MRRAIIVGILAVSGLCAQTAPAHLVNLAWQDPTNPTGTVYDVYRANGLCTSASAFTVIVSAIPGTLPAPVTVNGLTYTLGYTDTAVVAGGMYCYQVTAVLTGTESAPSNQNGVTIPGNPAIIVMPPQNVIIGFK